MKRALALVVLLGSARAEPLAARLIIETGEQANRNERIVRSIAWGSAEKVGYLRAEYQTEERSDGTEFSVALFPLTPRWVRRIAIELTLRGHAQVVDRGLAWRSITRTAYLDRFGPKEIQIGSTRLLIDDGIDEVIVRPNGPSTTVSLELFSTDARPFRYYAHCTNEWHQPNRKLLLPARRLSPTEILRAHLRTVWDVSPNALALSKARFPEGRDAALVISDHADQSSPETFAALVRGLLAHHLAITKSLFLQGSPRPQLDDPEVATLADELFRNGSEIIPHSATPHRDTRAWTHAALERFAAFRAVSWIDHQPETNCEAFTNQGFHSGPPYGVADLLAAHHYRYLWSADDAPAGQLNLLGDSLQRRVFTFWPTGQLQEQAGPWAEAWLFRSSWMFLERKHFLRAVAPSRLDALEQARGLAILHTYLETLHPRGTRFGLRNLLTRRPDEAIALAPEFDAWLGELRRRIDRGTLWVPTVRQLGDHLRALEQVTIRYPGDGSAIVSSPVEVRGISLSVSEQVAVEIDGHAPRGARSVHGTTAFWFDLAPNHPARVILSRGSHAIRFLSRE